MRNQEFFQYTVRYSTVLSKIPIVICLEWWTSEAISPILSLINWTMGANNDEGCLVWCGQKQWKWVLVTTEQGWNKGGCGRCCLFLDPFWLVRLICKKNNCIHYGFLSTYSILVIFFISSVKVHTRLCWCFIYLVPRSFSCSDHRVISWYFISIAMGRSVFFSR